MLNLDCCFPTDNLESIEKSLCELYEENLLIIYESVLAFVNENVDKLNLLSKEVEKIVKGGEGFHVSFDLQRLIKVLKENEEWFYNEVLGSNKPNFLMTSYYSYYLRFLELMNEKLHKYKSNYDVLRIVNFLVWFFGIPILVYLRKKEVVSCISGFSGILLHILVAEKVKHMV